MFGKKQIEELQQKNAELAERAKQMENQRNVLVKERDDLKHHLAQTDEISRAKDEMEHQRNVLVQERDELKRHVEQGSRGLKEEIAFLSFRNAQLSQLHDEVVVAKWGNDKSMREWTCTLPFTRMEIMPRGEVYTCCSAYVKHNHYIGNAYQDTFEAIWNSDKAKVLRYTVTEGDFEYCNKTCKWLHKDNIGAVGYRNPIIRRIDSPWHFSYWQDCSIASAPTEITLSCDDTCNLYCASCRSSVRGNSAEENQKLFDMLMRFVRPILKSCTFMTASTSGEFFASKPLQDFYKTLSKAEFPQLELSIVTNGQLLTVNKWAELQNLDGMIQRICVSVDAAEKKTYEILRRGGSWERLCSNMGFVKSLKQKGAIRYIVLHFVVQKCNYTQMPRFVELAQEWGADAIEFQKLGNWGTFSEDIYRENNVCDPENALFSETMEYFDIAKKQSEPNVSIVENFID